MRRWGAFLILVLAIAAEGSAQECPAIPSGPGFHAGFARRDLTPPPGAGLFGYGTDSRVAVGYRQRLKARAMVLRDDRGEVLIFAMADLDLISGPLQRAVAARIKACTGVDADRLLLSATHTHSGPGQFVGSKAPDHFGTTVKGFDAGLQAFLADRISEAVLEALARMRPARAAWGQAPLWGISRIRGWRAHSAEPHGLPSEFEPDSALRGTPQGEVDPTLTVFRVDTAAGPDRFIPAGAWALFAIHGTGIPAPNDLYDADVHGVAARVLEEGIDAENGLGHHAEPLAVAMIANGAEGNTLPETRAMQRECSPPVQRRELRPGSWRTPPGGDQWLDRPGHDVDACVAAGIADTRVVGTRLGHAALELFRSLGGALEDQVRLSRAFEVVPLRGAGAPAGLCPRAKSGMAQNAGAETRETRYLGYKWFGLVPSGMEPGGSAIRPGPGCWSPKRTLPGLLEKVLIGEHGFEEAAQLMVARVGNTLLGAVPFEPTTTVGARLRRAMSEASLGAGAPERVVVVGLAGNYIQYVTTRLEYAAQEYEGGATLYGPGSEEVFNRLMSGLTRRLAESGWSSPAAEVPPFPSFPGARRKIVRFGIGEPPRWQPVLRGVDLRPGRVVLRWEDNAPEWVIPRRRAVVVVEEEVSGSWRIVARDGTLDLEVRVIKDRGDRTRWEAHWLGTPAAGSRYRFRIPDPADPGWGVSMEFRAPIN